MTNVMYVDTVITVFIFLFLIFGYFFYGTKGCLFDGGNLSQNPKQQFSGANSTLSGAYSALWSRHTPLHRLTALNAGKGTEIITLSMHTIYHSDHTIPMIPASYRMHG